MLAEIKQELGVGICTDLHEPFQAEAVAKVADIAPTSALQSKYREDSQIIQYTFENQLYTLNATTAGHYGLRLFRQTLDPKYSAAVWSDLARVTSTLSYIADNIKTPEQVKDYGLEQLKSYKNKDGERTQLRYKITKKYPEYMLIGNDLLSTMARANEYGLKHKDDETFNRNIYGYIFMNMPTTNHLSIYFS